MLHAKKLPYYLWFEAMTTTCHVHSRVTTRFETKKSCMSYGKGERKISSISTSLEVSATFWKIESKGEKWIPRVRKVYSLVTPQIIERAECVTSTPRLRWNLLMWLLMTLFKIRKKKKMRFLINKLKSQPMSQKRSPTRDHQSEFRKIILYRTL